MTYRLLFGDCLMYLISYSSFFEGIFLNPTNAQLNGDEFKTLPVPDGAPDDYYEPPLTSHSGANYFDRKLSTLYVVVRGAEPVEIRTMPVIEVCKHIHVNATHRKP